MHLYSGTEMIYFKEIKTYILKKSEKKYQLYYSLIFPQSVKSIESVSRPVRISPSSQAASMELSYVAEDNKVTIIKTGQDVFGVAGENIKGLGEFAVRSFFVFFY